MSTKSERARRESYTERRQKLMSRLWGEELSTLPVWFRKEQKGFTTMPRTMPYLIKIMDKESGKGKPLGPTYSALWYRVFDEGFLEIKEEKTLAYEAGFYSQRAVDTWKSRMKKLEELGFINTKASPQSDFGYVIIINPFKAIEKLYDGKDKDGLYNALCARMVDVGAEWE